MAVFPSAFPKGANVQLDSEQQKYLQGIASRIREDILEMTCNAGSGHPGGSLSCVEILTVLYNGILRIDPQNPSWGNRDRFVLSKGHAASALYSALMERGFFPREEMKGFRNINGRLQGHPDMHKVPGIDISSGSLGQGLSVAVGMALGAKIQKKPFRVYALVGCGESQEGQIWEAAMSAAHFGLDNLTGILDYNGVQLDGRNKDVMGIEPVADKWKAFGWEVFSCDGHEIGMLHRTIGAASAFKSRPSMVVAKTVKGRGVSFMENECSWHGVQDPARLKDALEELKSCS